MKSANKSIPHSKNSVNPDLSNNLNKKLFDNVFYREYYQKNSRKDFTPSDDKSLWQIAGMHRRKCQHILRTFRNNNANAILNIFTRRKGICN